MEFYVDGVLHKNSNNSYWDQPASISIPDDTQLIAIKCRNTGGPAGIKVTLSNGIETSAEWKCYNKHEQGWNKHRFNDATWPNAQVVNQEWIWTAGNIKDETVYCRKFIADRKDFTWIPRTREPVIYTLSQDVMLNWEYLTDKLINKIIFSREHKITNHTIKIGMWTSEKGFKQNRVDLSTELVLKKISINNESGERISLELKQTIDDDFDKIYYCHVFYDDRISYKQGVELVAERSACKGERLQYYNNTLTFTWMYQYRYPITAVILSRIDSAGKKGDDLGYWYQNKFENDPLFKDRVVFNITDLADKKRKITLLLSNKTPGDFNLTYICRVIPADGQFCQCQLTVDDDVKVVETDNSPGLTCPEITGIVVGVSVLVPVVVIIVAIVKLRKKEARKGKFRFLIPMILIPLLCVLIAGLATYFLCKNSKGTGAVIGTPAVFGLVQLILEVVICYLASRESRPQKSKKYLGESPDEPPDKPPPYELHCSN
ncbi:uncharacterized protein LOC126830921 isoform X2 [Patella vulgata]|nr:uncharacterized protein LOC126830921 isoform X2 [Patella vulgata]